MTHGERLDLICATLLLPFTEPAYGSVDPIWKKAACFLKFLLGEGRENKLYAQYTKLQNEILQQLTGRASKPQRLDELTQILDIFYGDNTLSEFLMKNKASQSKNAFSLDDFYIERIREISDSFLTLRDGHPALRNWHNTDRNDLFPDVSKLHKAEIWNMLVRQSTPDLWIAGYYAFSPHITLPMLRNVPDEPILADQILMAKLSQGLADTHTHFHAGMNYQVQWELVTDLTTLRHDIVSKNGGAQKDPPEYLCLILKAGILRLMLSFYLQSDLSYDFISYWKKRLPLPLFEVLYAAVYSGTIVDEPCKTCLSTFITWRQQLFSCFPDLQSSPVPAAKPWADILMRSVYAKWAKLNTSSDVLLFFQGLRLANGRKHPEFCHALLQYIRLKNHFFKPITQTEVIHGLRQFRQYYSYGRSIVNMLRENDGSNSQDIDRAIFLSYIRQPYLQLLEIKIGPSGLDSVAVPNDILRLRYKGNIRRRLRDLFTAYYSVLDDLANFNRIGDETPGQTLDRLQREQNLSIPTLGIVYHFMKLDQKRSFYRQICWADKEQDKDRSGVYPETLRKASMLFCDMLTELFQEIPYSAEYVVGIDAASDEMHNEPWVYAPIFRYARSRHNTYPIQPETKSALPNLGLTYHVGEEFRSLLSGLRAIDEVVEHFGFKTGDRLGHAVALQVDPKLWQYENATSVLPTIEYLENLLWLWHLKGEAEFGSAFGSIPDLEQKIMGVARQLYPNYEGLSPYLLWRGYQLKFQSLTPDTIQRFRASMLPLCAYSSRFCPECQAYQASKNAACRSAYVADRYSGMEHFNWSEQDLLLSHFCPAIRKKYTAPMFVTTSQDEIALLAELQKYLRAKIERKGLTVESNPTSNSAISEIQHLFGHPLLKLNNCGLSHPGGECNHMAVTINTDDPLIFRTTVENEISYIYYMLLDMQYRQIDVLNWIDQIRQFGIDRCFIRHPKAPSVQYAELKEMISVLKDK